jgi:hypothetical protein
MPCREQSEVDTDLKLVAPHGHAQQSAMNLVADPNNPARFASDATADELRQEIMYHVGVLVDGGVLDLEALLAPKRGSHRISSK